MYAALKLANGYAEILKGQYHQPQLHFHGELLNFAVLEILERSSVWRSIEMLNYKHMYLKAENNLYFYYKKHM